MLSNMNIFGVWTVLSDKARHQKMSFWALENYDDNRLYFLIFYRRNNQLIKKIFSRLINKQLSFAAQVDAVKGYS